MIWVLPTCWHAGVQDAFANESMLCREQVQLLLSGLYRLAQQQDRRDASQRRAAIAQAITGIMEHLPSGSAALGPALPLESDPSFWVSPPVGCSLEWPCCARLQQQQQLFTARPNVMDCLL